MNVQVVEAMAMNYDNAYDVIHDNDDYYLNKNDESYDDVEDDNSCGNCSLDCKDYCHKQGSLFDSYDVID